MHLEDFLESVAGQAFRQVTVIACSLAALAIGGWLLMHPGFHLSISWLVGLLFQPPPELSGWSWDRGTPVALLAPLGWFDSPAAVAFVVLCFSVCIGSVSLIISAVVRRIRRDEARVRHRRSSRWLTIAVWIVPICSCAGFMALWWTEIPLRYAFACDRARLEALIDSLKQERHGLFTERSSQEDILKEPVDLVSGSVVAICADSGFATSLILNEPRGILPGGFVFFDIDPARLGKNPVQSLSCCNGSLPGCQWSVELDERWYAWYSPID